ncbi:MAG: hypothetical protein GY798_17925 [Hyphomicrobiales bacterium]|nr:hypothetical protein [Hyphomicrobiales bacterium]
MAIHPGRLIRTVSAAAVASLGVAVLAPTAIADDPALAPCIGAVGTFLTTNYGEDGPSDKFVSRSLISLTNGGHAFFTDSDEPGGNGFSPFSEARGAWRCDAAEDGTEQITATVIDFVFPSTTNPKKRLGRLDIDATFDPATGMLSGTMTLFMMAFDANPLIVNDEPVATASFDGLRITVQ